MTIRLPQFPYLRNIVKEYRLTHSYPSSSDEFHTWLRQFGFTVPVQSGHLEFPDDFSDQELMLFMLKYQ